MQSIEVNKSIIRDFYRRAVANGDLDYARQIIADEYIQHSSAVPPGKAGLMEALRYLSQMPKPATSAKPFMRLLAEGQYVVTNTSVKLGDKTKAVVDLFRLDNGQVVEHWDAIEDQPETTRNGNPMMDGDVAVEDMALTGENKKIAEEFFQRVLVDRDLKRLPDFVTANLIQHQPEIANGLDGLAQYLRKKADLFAVQKVHRIIGEGNFVVIQSEGQLGLKPYAFYHIFRLHERRIVEQWAVKQLLPN
ncbi:nuclear transport factor 2 family protein [Larkinella insperata]|uniref:Nuclear transport factor 2 family protein n=1 Tax=Larkinella insperata TaxID=332158 RepID=A0ABW3QKW5_9BACT|nr:nuclear transport factor 2 family protein [Larkinella insperata]